ncbi:MAG: hypothetical protein H6739_39790 [Alphaproteobacteria bacterium]|nr:hypothetical protein [Alphaproteobacteria bacterium]
MGLLDDLEKMLGQAVAATRKSAGDAAAKAARRQAERRVEGALDGFAADAEARLKAAQEADAKRDKPNLPVGEVETPDWARRAEETAEAARPAGDARPSAQDKEARARAELEALKAKMKRG